MGEIKHITVHGMTVPAPNYMKTPFVYGASIAYCTSCGDALDTHDYNSRKELMSWTAVKKGGRIVGFTCPRCAESGGRWPIDNYTGGWESR